MRATAALLTVALLAACAPKEAAPPAAKTVADFAGTWAVSSTLDGTPTPVPSTMTSTADGASWTMSLEGRPNVALTVSVVGDSLIGQSAEYESILRKGVMVSVRTASTMNGNTLTGNMTATYKSATGAEIVKGTLTATKQ